jgi:hypothetical protein
MDVYEENVGLLTKIALVRGKQLYGVRPIDRPEEAGTCTFKSPAKAGHHAEEWATLYDTTYVVEMIVRGRAFALIATIEPGQGDDGDDGDDTGVREPRRPMPGSSAGAVELDLPN